MEQKPYQRRLRHDEPQLVRSMPVFHRAHNLRRQARTVKADRLPKLFLRLRAREHGRVQRKVPALGMPAQLQQPFLLRRGLHELLRRSLRRNFGFHRKVKIFLPALERFVRSAEGDQLRAVRQKQRQRGKRRVRVRIAKEAMKTNVRVSLRRGSQRAKLAVALRLEPEAHLRRRFLFLKRDLPENFRKRNVPPRVRRKVDVRHLCENQPVHIVQRLLVKRNPAVLLQIFQHFLPSPVLTRSACA